MQTILVGINYSTLSPNVLEYAFCIAQYFDANLIVAHYLDNENKAVQNLPASGEQSWEGIYEDLRLKELDKLKAFVSLHQTKQYHLIPIQVEVGFGNAHEGLHHLAQKVEADLLILGKFTVSKWHFFADTADKIISWTLCPVLIVPEGFRFQGMNRVIYASDFELEDCEALLFLLPWMKTFSTELVCLHVCKQDKDRPLAERKMRILNRLFPYENMSFRLVTADVETGIDRFVALSKSDIVATLHRHRNIWEELFEKSISKAISRDVKVPMLVFRQQ